ncbi:MAG: radical SAM protein [Bacteroidota bacterium]
MKRLLDDIENGRLSEEYICGMDLNYAFDYSLLDRMAIKYLPVLSSLGCRNTCEYCCAASLYHGNYRLRHPDFVMADLQAIRKRSRYAAFLDSNIYNNAAYLRQLCARIIDERVDSLWGAQATIDIGEDAETLSLLYKAGCRVLYIGFETLNQVDLTWLNKPYDIERYECNALRIREAGIHVFGYFILGLDNDSQDTFKAVRSFVRKTRMAVPIINILTPVPGTDTYNRLRRENRILFSEDSFLEDNHRYSVPCNSCYYIPRNFTPMNLEQNFIALYRSLCTWPEILRRSLDAPPRLAANLLYMNVKMRAEYKSLRSVTCGNGPTLSRGKSV